MPAKPLADVCQGHAALAVLGVGEAVLQLAARVVERHVATAQAPGEGRGGAEVVAQQMAGAGQFVEVFGDEQVGVLFCTTWLGIAAGSSAISTQLASSGAAQARSG